MKSLAQQSEVFDEVMVELSRAKTPAELTLMASRLFAANRDRLKAYLQMQHPEWTSARLHEELLRRIHGAA